MEINEKIQMYRKQKKKTLKEISEKTDLSISFLSQLEHGKTSAALVSLRKIADALEVNVSDFFDDFKPSEVVVKGITMNQLAALEKDHVEYHILSGDFSNRKLECLYFKMAPMFTDDDVSSHMGEEFYYVTKGIAKFVIDGEEFIVNAGESIHYSSMKKHKIMNEENEVLEMIAIITPKIL